MSICARDANVARYAKGHVHSKITPHTLQTTILHGCFQDAYSAWTGLDAPSSCLNIAVSVGSRARAGVFIVAIGSYRGRNVVRRAASRVLFDCDVFKFVTSRDTFQVCTGVMPIAKTRGMRSCTCHDLSFRVMICHVMWKHYHWTNKVCV